MKNILSICIIFIVLIAGCRSNSQNASAEKESYEKTKETLEQKEKKNPLLFLSISNNEKRNLIGQTVIKGHVINNAKVCSYKDVQLEVAFYSKTGVLLEKGNETVYEEIVPGRSLDFKFKNFAPKGTDSIAIKVLGATPK